MLSETISRNIRNFREEKRLSQIDLSKRLGITQQAVSLWETGRKCPKLKDIETIASALEVKVETLLGLDQTPAQN